MTEIFLPLKPISINQYWQGKRYLTRKGKDFREYCLWLLPRPKKKQLNLKGCLEVEIIVYLKKAWLKSDVDNFLKPLIDAICKKGFMADDRFITDLTIRKRQDQRNWVEIKIKNYGGTPKI